MSRATPWRTAASGESMNDPPYFGRHIDYFNSWNETDEAELFKSLEKTNAKFILSTWHSNRFRENQELGKYENLFEIITKEHFYHVGASENNRNPMTEAIILNFKTSKPKSARQTYQKQLFATSSCE